MRRIVIYSDDQERQEIVVLDGDTELFSSSQDHDMHGWDGMEVARDVAEGIGKALNIPVDTEYKEFD